MMSFMSKSMFTSVLFSVSSSEIPSFYANVYPRQVMYGLHALVINLTLNIWIAMVKDCFFQRLRSSHRV